MNLHARTGAIDFGGFKIVTLTEIQAIQTRDVWPSDIAL